MTTKFVALLQEVASTLGSLAESGYPALVEKSIDLIAEAFLAGHKLLIFGNGGSASDAQHIAAEFVGHFLLERQGLPAIALTENSAVITAWANDCQFDKIFSRQISALGIPGDVAWGISTSGNSKNVIEGLIAARSAGLRTIGMTGATGGQMTGLCDVLLCAPPTATARIQEVHLVTYHAICGAVEDRLARVSKT